MDDIDHIQQRDDILHQLALMKRKPTLVSANGQCLWCHDEPVSGLSLAFCSTECGEDYEKFQRNKKRSCIQYRDHHNR
ncbi:Uncharacterised protein [Providencia rettgeri]|uniref:DUF2116 family Zn-ribbon domain-containing protein n=1 Tax=Providencia rettgeri TaxID=587 RepID=A0A379LQ83_PRORE|nr:Uncharacterised protein [Providencia rettgeri]